MILTYLIIHHEQVEWIELSRIVIYHFAVPFYVIVNEKLMFKDRRIRASIQPVTARRTAYFLHRSHSASTKPRGRGMVWQENHSEQLYSYRILRIFSEFINFLILFNIFLFLPTWENMILKNSGKILKKFSEHYEKKKRFFSCNFSKVE